MTTEKVRNMAMIYKITQQTRNGEFDWRKIDKSTAPNASFEEGVVFYAHKIQITKSKELIMYLKTDILERNNNLLTISLRMREKNSLKVIKRLSLQEYPTLLGLLKAVNNDFNVYKGSDSN